MKILVAEDEETIADTYKLALEAIGHEVFLTKNGEECVNHYLLECKSDSSQTTPVVESQPPDKKGNGPTMFPRSYSRTQTPFDIVILDYRMPIKNGLQVAKEILQQRPNQRIIFTSAYIRDILLESVKELHHVVELLQKPFELDELIAIVENKAIYKELEKLNANIKKIKDWNPTHAELSDLLDGLSKINRTDFNKEPIFSQS